MSIFCFSIKGKSRTVLEKVVNLRLVVKKVKLGVGLDRSIKLNIMYERQVVVIKI